MRIYFGKRVSLGFLHLEYYSVFFYVWLNFVLRGVQEQHDLIPSQFLRVPHEKTVYNSSVYYEYTELASKNNQHRFKDINVQNKVTRAYALRGNQKCVVKILDEYLSLLLCNALYFYIRSFAKVKEILRSLDNELV